MSCDSRRGIALTLTLSFAMGQASAARANEPSAEGHAAIVELFGRGVQLAKLGQCDVSPIGDFDVCKQARDTFAQVYALDASALGALRNMASIEDQLGLYATAAAHYRDLIHKAPDDPNLAHRAWGDWAREQVARLHDVIPRLTVAPVSAPADLVILLDGMPLSASAWGVPIEVDPGTRTIKAEAAGFHPFESRVEASVGGYRTIVVALTPSVETSAALAATPIESREEVASKPDVLAPPSAPPAPPSAARTLWPWALVGAGGLATGLGAGFGIAAINEHGAACPGTGKTCSAHEYGNGLALADTSTVFVAAGGAVMAVGIVWKLVSGATAKMPVRGTGIQAAFVGSGFGVQGAFQ